MILKNHDEVRWKLFVFFFSFFVECVHFKGPKLFSLFVYDLHAFFFNKSEKVCVKRMCERIILGMFSRDHDVLSYPSVTHDLWQGNIRQQLIRFQILAGQLVVLHVRHSTVSVQAFQDLGSWPFLFGPKFSSAFLSFNWENKTEYLNIGQLFLTVFFS